MHCNENRLFPGKTSNETDVAQLQQWLEKWPCNIVVLNGKLSLTVLVAIDLYMYHPRNRLN